MFTDPPYNVAIDGNVCGSGRVKHAEFGGSGSTLIAAEKCGRSARVSEYEPGYCDVIVQRWQQLTGKQATLMASGETFEDVREKRIPPAMEQAA